MNRMKVVAVSFACVAVLFGCVVQSVHPFFTKEAVVPIPEGMKGEWEIAELFDKEVKKEVHPWSFDTDEIKTYSEENRKSNIKTIYFKAGDKLFVNCSPGDLDKEAEKFMNEYWIFSVAEINHVCKVELSGDKLKLIPLNYEWMVKQLEEKKISLPHVMRKNGDDPKGFPLFTASSKEWMAFLEKYGSDNEAFNPKLAFKFKKASPLPASPPPTPKQP